MWCCHEQAQDVSERIKVGASRQSDGVCSALVTCDDLKIVVPPGWCRSGGWPQHVPAASLSFTAVLVLFSFEQKLKAGKSRTAFLFVAKPFISNKCYLNIVTVNAAKHISGGNA